MYSWGHLLGSKSQMTRDPLNGVKRTDASIHKVHLFRRLQLSMRVKSLVVFPVFERGKKSVIVMAYFTKGRVLFLEPHVLSKPD